MKVSEMKEVAEGIIKEGFEQGLDEDDIKGNMFGAKIPFSKINSLFRSIAIASGLMVDPKTVTAEVTAQVTESDWEACEKWEHVEAYVQQICDEVQGATPARVLTLAKKFCKEEEITLPKAVKAPKASRARGSVVVGAMVDLFNEVQKPTKEQAYNAVLPLVKGPKNAADSVRMFYPMAYAIANELSLKDAIQETAEMEIPQAEVPAADIEEVVESDEVME